MEAVEDYYERLPDVEAADREGSFQGGCFYSPDRGHRRIYFLERWGGPFPVIRPLELHRIEITNDSMELESHNYSGGPAPWEMEHENCLAGELDAPLGVTDIPTSSNLGLLGLGACLLAAAIWQLRLIPTGG